MLSVLVEGVLGLLLLYLAGEALVRGASGLALRMGIPALAVGLTVVAFGTSMPELIVSLDAALTGVNDIAVGNVVGSNICNLALILGVSALVRPIVVHSRLVRLDWPLMVVCSLALVLLLANGRVSRLEAALLVSALVAYTAWTLRQARSEEECDAAEGEEGMGPGDGLFFTTFLVVFGLGGLIAGAHLLVGASVELAAIFGVGQAVVGLTIVAVGTSLPELTTSLVAAARGQGDIAMGNVIGSNIFNVLGIVGATALVHPLVRGGVAWIDLGSMVGLAAFVLLLAWTRERLSRPEALLLVLSYAGYVGFRFAG